MRISRRYAIAGAVAFGLSMGAAAASATSWDMPTPYGDKTFHTVNIRQFAKDVEQATGGKLKITVHSAGSLIKHPGLRTRCAAGWCPSARC